MNKALTYTFLGAITLLLCNATAVNRYSFNNLLPKPTFKGAANFASNLVESSLVKSLMEIMQGKNQQVLNTIDQLLLTTPNFKLANLVRGDLLMLQGQHLERFGGANGNPTEAVKDLQAEAHARIKRYLSKQDLDKPPNLLLAPNESQSHVIVVDTDKSRLNLYKNIRATLSYVAHYYITVGKNSTDKQAQGNKRTPLGVYFAEQKSTRPLADIYGDAAYPLNYPNERDAAHHRSGSGIWLHGTPSNIYSRPARVMVA